VYHVMINDATGNHYEYWSNIGGTPNGPGGNPPGPSCVWTS
jgi:hypothetical protein